MKSFENKEGVTKFRYRTKVYYFCEIGKDHCAGEIDAVIENAARYCDYNEMGNYFKFEMSGITSTHEKINRLAFDYFDSVFKPEHLTVTVTARDGMFDHIETSITK